MSIKDFINKFYAFASYSVLIIGIYLIFLFNGQDDSGNYGVDAIVLSVIWIVLWYIVNKRLHNFKWINSNANLNTQNAEIKAVLTKNKKLFIVIFALLKFLILLLGFLFIWNLSGSDFAAAFVFITFSPIWLFIWYMAIMTEWIITDKGKMSSSSKIAALLPLIGVLSFIVWLNIIHPVYYHYKHKRLIEKQYVLTNSILNNNQKDALKLINKNTYENYGVLDLDSIYFPVLCLAAQNDIVIYEALLNKFEKPNSLASGDISKHNEICVFCYIDDEDLALKTLDKVSMGFWNYSTSLYCDNKDILIYFIEKKWIRCIDAYLTKYKETIHRLHRSFEPYNCQIKITNTLEAYPKHLIVSPYSFTNDSAVISCLQKYSFAEADSNAIEICDSLSIVTINTQTEN